jgi:2-hydroxy-3-keto-5-methylthiopentenyl-1-phosphate phosphatase
MKTLVQCDFDGTITEEDASFFILDAYAEGDWRRLLQEYKERRISVCGFNTVAFSMVKADKPALLQTLKGKVKVRAGFHELVDYCLRKGVHPIIPEAGVQGDLYGKRRLRFCPGKTRPSRFCHGRTARTLQGERPELQTS